MLYFWTVAKEGSLRMASERLHVSQPSISTQIKQFEEALGTSLFTRTARRLVLTDTGQTVLEYADEIFSLGSELLTILNQKPGRRPLRLHVGIADSVPKIVVRQHLAPAFKLEKPIRITCREGSLEELVAQLVGFKLDLVLADEPSTSALRVKTFNQRISQSNIVLCAVPALAKELKKNFPQSLNGAPAVLPVIEMGLRRQLEHWFESLGIQPHVVAEVADSALMTNLAAQGLGFMPVYSAVVKETVQRYRLSITGVAKGLRADIFAITAQRRTQHPGVIAITTQAV